MMEERVSELWDNIKQPSIRATDAPKAGGEGQKKMRAEKVPNLMTTISPQIQGAQQISNGRCQKPQ